MGCVRLSTMHAMDAVPVRGFEPAGFQEVKSLQASDGSGVVISQYPHNKRKYQDRLSHFYTTYAEVCRSLLPSLHIVPTWESFTMC